MKSNVIFRKVSILIEMSSIVLLLSVGVEWWVAVIVVCAVSFFSYMDGLTREKRINR